MATISQINQEVLQRKLKNCIAKFPVRVRHFGREFYVRLNSTIDYKQLLDGGTLDNMSVMIIAAKTDFGDRLPMSMDDFDLLVNSQWVRLQIRDVPDAFDPLSPSYTINLQSPDKGIE